MMIFLYLIFAFPQPVSGTHPHHVPSVNGLKFENTVHPQPVVSFRHTL